MINKKPWLPLTIVFTSLSAIFLVMQSWLLKQEVDVNVLLIGNIIIYLATLFSLLVYVRSMKATGGGAAVRGMYGSFIIKFFTCLLAAFVYIMVAKKGVNKAALIGCMVLYVIYTVIEVSTLQKLLKQQKSENLPGK